MEPGQQEGQPCDQRAGALSHMIISPTLEKRERGWRWCSTTWPMGSANLASIKTLHTDAHVSSLSGNNLHVDPH